MENILLLSGCLIVNDKKELLLLFRKDHKYYETPGGKVKSEECLDFNKPTINELAKTAERELFEELGNNIKIEPLKYFGNINFTIPDGRKAIANKFLTKIISGKPIINEPETFSKLDYLPIQNLEDYPISPDLKLFLKNIKMLI